MNIKETGHFCVVECYKSTFLEYWVVHWN